MKQQPLSFSRYQLAISLSSVSIVSLAIITFEITLTRIFSVIYSYHYSFFAISLTLLGLGIGGILAHMFASKASSGEAFSSLARISLLFSLSVSLLTVIAATAPQPSVIASAVLLFFPFLIGGIFLAAAYKLLASYSNTLYFFDLVGAAMGSLAVLVLLPHCGALNTVLLTGIISSIGSTLLAIASQRRRLTYVTMAGLVVLALSAQYFHSNQILEVQIAGDQDKELYDMLKDPSLGAKIVGSRWSTFGRTDVVELEKNPDVKTIFIDASAATNMYRFDGDFGNISEVSQLKYFTAYYPYYFSNKDQVLTIGPGGGVDVLMALIAGVNHTAAVEVNPEVVNIVREYSDFNGGIYTKYDNVHVFIDEGRSFLKRTTAKYDLIMLNIPITKTSQGTGGYSLAENYLFTTESFRDYLDHLRDQGYLAIVAHNRVEVYKLVAIALEVLLEAGVDVKESMNQIVVAEMHHSHFPLFMLRKTAFTLEEIKAMYAKSRELNLSPVYFPYMKLETSDPALVGLANEEISLEDVISHLRDINGVNIEPPTDDKPFFYRVESGLPTTLLQLLAGSITSSLVLLVLYHSMRRRRLHSINRYPSPLRGFVRSFTLFMPYYFSIIGLGFMLIEISLIQKFTLFLGQPTVAISVLLFSMLLSSGVGGLCSRKLKESMSSAFKASLAVGVLVVLYILVLPSIFNEFLSYDSNVRFLISFIIVFPLGFFMGIPFPAGIGAVNGLVQEDVSWMWGLNGVYSLLGSILAIAAAMSFGFSLTLLFGGLSYLLIFVIGYSKLNMKNRLTDLGGKI